MGKPIIDDELRKRIEPLLPPAQPRRFKYPGRKPVAALLMGPDGAFITGRDFLMDGGVTASYWFGSLAPQ
jgi:hypothetical protein